MPLHLTEAEYEALLANSCPEEPKLAPKKQKRQGVRKTPNANQRGTSDFPKTSNTEDLSSALNTAIPIIAGIKLATNPGTYMVLLIVVAILAPLITNVIAVFKAFPLLLVFVPFFVYSALRETGRIKRGK
jgi:hypothetical protein